MTRLVLSVFLLFLTSIALSNAFNLSPTTLSSVSVVILGFRFSVSAPLLVVNLRFFLFSTFCMNRARHLARRPDMPSLLRKKLKPCLIKRLDVRKGNAPLTMCKILFTTLRSRKRWFIRALLRLPIWLIPWKRSTQVVNAKWIKLGKLSALSPGFSLWVWVSGGNFPFFFAWDLFFDSWLLSISHSFLGRKPQQVLQWVGAET